MNQSKSVHLAPPGAGLPWPENWLTRFFGPRLAKKHTWDQNLARFEKESKRILELAMKFADDHFCQQVLIDRLPGLEDSSRNWSASMTLEHLVIVSEQICQVIVTLAQDKIPDGKADTAKVKPFANRSKSAAVSLFEKMTSEVKIQLSAPKLNRDSQLRFNHPWFGKISALQWNWLIAQHLMIHRKQLEVILKGLHK